MGRESRNLNEPATIGDLLNFEDRIKRMLDEFEKNISLAEKNSLVDVAQFCTFLGGNIDCLTVNEWCRSGFLLCTKRGNQWFIMRSEVDRIRKEALENKFAQPKSPTRRDRRIIEGLLTQFKAA